MKLSFSKEFDKRYRALRKNQLKVDNALLAFMKDQNSSSLRYHELKGEWRNHFSISAGSDLRVHLKYIEREDVLVVTLGTHGQLYR